MLFYGDVGALPCFSVPYGSVPFGRSVCPAVSRTSVTARDREENSRASGNVEDRKQLEYTYQMYSTCLQIPIQDFLERNGVVHYVAFVCWLPRALDSSEYQHTHLDVTPACWTRALESLPV